MASDQPTTIAVDGVQYRFQDKGNSFVESWHPVDDEPEGEPFGSAAICLTSNGGAIVGSAGGTHGWEMPGGRPEPGETWRTTLDREVMEEACSSVDEATLLGYVRAECLSGPETGRVLVRSAWVAKVTVLPWRPTHEIKIRRTVPLSEVLNIVSFPEGQYPVWRRWIEEATKYL